MASEATYSTQDLARMLGCSKGTILRAIQSGRLKAMAKTSPAVQRKAAYYRVTDSQLQEFLASQPQPQAS